MEGSMLVDDYLFVNKLSYGPRIPMTPVAVPLVHNTMPVTGGKSYAEGIQWGYHRLPGFGPVDRYDVVVFNYPAGDTVMAERPADDYYSALRDEYQGDRESINSRFKIITRPVDKKENYIKRCVALPGDKLEVRDAVLYINDKLAQQFQHQKIWYIVNGRTPAALSYLSDNEIEAVPPMITNGMNNVFFLEKVQAEEMAKLQGVEVKPYVYPRGVVNINDLGVFPQDTANFKFNRDNFGPIVIPKQGATVQLTAQNIALYRRVIRNYEHNKLEERDGKIFINDKEATSYTFQMDYYWMMGDNRDNSLDSRYWGYVPVDHVVGKAWFVWFSYHKEGLAKGIRWGRLFHSVHALED
jgi:signal peptidase I